MNNQNTHTSSPSGPDRTSQPDPEVVAQAKRRRFTAAYKQRILAQADQAKGSGGGGALLRREGLYSSLLKAWRREMQSGIRQALTPQKRGPKAKRDPLQDENQKLQKENARLVEELRKAAIVIDVPQKNGRAVGVAGPDARPGRAALMEAVTQLTPTVGVAAACAALGVPRASFYRQPVYAPALSRRAMETGSGATTAGDIVKPPPLQRDDIMLE